MSCLLVHSEWSQIVKCLSTGTAEPLGVHELVSRGAASVTFDESSCRTYHTDVVFRW